MKAIWALGFRPFFLLAGLSAVLLIGLWLYILLGLGGAGLSIPPLVWHTHEMIFGFAIAVLAGFLLTSTQNWSGRRGVHGKPLMFLVLLWVLGRLSFFFGPHFLLSFIDLLFVPVLAFFLWPYLFIKGQNRNRVFIFFLTILFAANLLIHLDLLGLVNNMYLKGTYLALYVFVAVLLLIGGRVIPFFSSRVLGTPQVIALPWLEQLSVVAMGTFIFSDFFTAESYKPILGLILGLIHLMRWTRWRPLNSLKIPILLILYLAYLWLIIGFFLVGAKPYLDIPQSVVTHAFSLGGLGVMTYGMMTRVSLGHTGRVIRAHSLISLGYFALNLSAIVRVLLVWGLPGEYKNLIFVSGLLWIFAFLVFVIKYWNILVSERLDGKPG